MKNKTLLPTAIVKQAGLILLLSAFNFQLSTWAQGTAFTYQGRLNDGANAANGHYDLRFILFNVNQSGSPVGPILTNPNVIVTNGLFSATLDFGGGIFMGSNYWLEIGVRTNGSGAFTTLVPRQQLTPTPYAVFAENVGSGGLTAGTYSNAVTFSNAANNFSGSFTGNGAGLTNVNAATLGGLSSSNFWKLGGNAGANPTNGNFLGTTDNLPLEFKVNGLRALRIEPTINDANHSNIVNVVGGSPVNYVSNSVVGATIGGGGAATYFFIHYTNSVTADFGTVGGGAQNAAGGRAATVGGGLLNAANGLYGTVGGGYLNTVSDNYATVGGGNNNTATGRYGTLGGGDGNIASGFEATVGGGAGNTASGSAAIVGGGSGNIASGGSATVGGGSGNTASNYDATVGGGYGNIASGSAATVGGGYGNTASADYATAGGGYGNTASGRFAMVPGGYNNIAAGEISFAAGSSARANHQGAFVWADSQDGTFSSTTSNQFLIRAQGGVGIGNNSPQAPLHVTGGGDASLSSGGNLISGLASGQNLVIDNNEIISRNNGAASDLILNFGSGNVGIGRTPAANRLEVGGEASKATAGNWLANSDARIKTGVQTVTNALEKLEHVRLVQFRYTDDYRAAHPGIENREYLNVVAQEFQKVFPEDVKRSGEKLPNGGDILQVDTYPLTIYSAAAIQELNQKLELQSREKDAHINTLEKELRELKQTVKRLSDRRD